MAYIFGTHPGSILKNNGATCCKLHQQNNNYSLGTTEGRVSFGVACFMYWNIED